MQGRFTGLTETQFGIIELSPPRPRLGGCPRIHLEKKRTTKNRSRPVALVSFWDKKGII